jgi:hypothetical protein
MKRNDDWLKVSTCDDETGRVMSTRRADSDGHKIVFLVDQTLECDSKNPV